MASVYQVGFVGRLRDEGAIVNQINTQAAQLGIDPGGIVVMAESQIASRDRKRPFVGLFFGYSGVSDSSHPIIEDLLKDSLVIIPIV